MWRLTNQVLRVAVDAQNVTSACAACVADDGWDGLEEQGPVEIGGFKKGLQVRVGDVDSLPVHGGVVGEGESQEDVPKFLCQRLLARGERLLPVALCCGRELFSEAAEFCDPRRVTDDAGDCVDLIVDRWVFHGKSVIHDVEHDVLAIGLRIAVVVDQIGVGVCMGLVVEVDETLDLSIGRCVGVGLHSSPHRTEGESLHVKAGDDSEVVAASFQPKKEIRVRVGIDVDDLALSRDELNVDEAVGDESHGGGKPGVASSGYQPAGANVRVSATSNHQALGFQVLIHLQPASTRANGRNCLQVVDGNGIHSGHIDCDSIADARCSREGSVSAALDRELALARHEDFHGCRDLVRASGADDAVRGIEGGLESPESFHGGVVSSGGRQVHIVSKLGSEI